MHRHCMSVITGDHVKGPDSNKRHDESKNSQEHEQIRNYLKGKVKEDGDNKKITKAMNWTKFSTRRLGGQSTRACIQINQVNPVCALGGMK